MEMVKSQGEGIPGHDGLLHQIKQPQNNFRIALRRTAPCFVPRYRNERSDQISYAGSESEENSFGAADSSTVYSAGPPSSAPFVSKPVLSEMGFTASAPAVSRSAYRGGDVRASAPVNSKPVYTEGGFSPHTYPQFLVGEEDSKEIGLNDGKEVFINDVLETAEWCVPWLCSVSLAHNNYFYQCSHKRATKQLSFYSPEGVHPWFRWPMGRARPSIIHNCCREGKRGHLARYRHLFRELHPYPFQATSIVS